MLLKIGMKEDDILNTFRAGRGTDRDGNIAIRPIIIRLPDADTLARYTRNGIGKSYKVAKEATELTGEDGEDEYNYYWLNRDLCAADRHANFLERKRRSSTGKKDIPQSDEEGGENSQTNPVQDT